MKRTLLAGLVVAAVALSAAACAGNGSNSMPGMEGGMGMTPSSVMTGGNNGTPGAGGAMDSMILPPGMIMTQDISNEAMASMAAVNVKDITYEAPADARGDQPLEPRIENGVKVFDLEASIIKWNILPDVQVAAYAFNRQVPGPRLAITQGDRVRINVKNSLQEPTSVHWHGLAVPNGMDGASDVTQPPIAPGETFAYEFTAEQAGTYFYHSHAQADRQQALGLYGALIVAAREAPTVSPYAKDVVIQLQEWTLRDGNTFPAMQMEGLLPNYFTINGKAFPATETINLKVGESVRLRFVGSNTGFAHPMHVHGGPFTIIETDGNPVPAGAQLVKDTINVAPGERYDVVWTARQPGKWLIHCHIPHHTTNNNEEVQGGGGLTMVIQVSPS